MDFETLTKKYFSPKKRIKKSIFIINPDNYWKGVLVFLAIMIILFFAFGFYLLNKIDSADVAPEDLNVVKIKTINQERLNKVLDYFEKREKASMNIINLPSPIVDPSL